MIAVLIDYFLHLDQHLQTFFGEYGLWVYALMFVIIFAETGFVVTPFLPGDSLLFAAGALGLDPKICIIVLSAAARVPGTQSILFGPAIVAGIRRRGRGEKNLFVLRY